MTVMINHATRHAWRAAGSRWLRISYDYALSLVQRGMAREVEA